MILMLLTFCFMRVITLVRKQCTAVWSCFQESDITQILLCFKSPLEDLKYAANGCSVACEFSQWNLCTASCSTKE